MKKASHQKNVKIHMRVIALFLCALIFSSCTNCASCNFADLFNIEIIPNASEKENASGIEGSSDEEKHTHTHSQTQTEKYTELPTEEPTEPTEPALELDEQIKEEIQLEYWDQFVGREKYKWESYPDVQFLGKFSDAYAVNVLTEKGKIGIYFIEGYEFRHKRDDPPYIYRQGKFYTLENALSSGIITLDNLESIYDKFVQVAHNNYKRIYQLVAPPETDFSEVMDFSRVNINIQPEYNSKEYTAEDFADIGCTEINDHNFKGEPHEIYRYMTLIIDAKNVDDLMKAIRTLEKREDIYSASPSFYYGTDSYPNDEEYHTASGDYWAAEKIELFDAWEIETGSNTVLVGVIDTGVDGTQHEQ